MVIKTVVKTKFNDYSKVVTQSSVKNKAKPADLFPFENYVKYCKTVYLLN